LIHQASDEHNFHVFYEMLAAATLQERTQLLLENYTAHDFKMTSQSGTYTCWDGVNDAKLFDKLVLAMRTLGFDPDIQMDIFTVVTAILHASNRDFVGVTRMTRVQSTRKMLTCSHFYSFWVLTGMASYKPLVGLI
jgi:myosin heavy subunit